MPFNTQMQRGPGLLQRLRSAADPVQNGGHRRGEGSKCMSRIKSV